MAKHIRDLMTPNPVTLSAASTLVDAAIAMRDFDVGAVIVVDNGQIYGIVNRPRYRRSRYCQWELPSDY